MFTQEFAAAKEAARRAGDIIARYYREGVTMRNKGEGETYNLVSDADVEAEHAIVGLLKQQFPEHDFLGEESYVADAGAEQLWVIDPLDGTNNFAHQIPQFSVSIAYCYQGQAVCGVVYNPIRDEWYTALKGEGAFFNERRIQVSTKSRLAEALVGVGFYYDRGAMMEATLASIHDLFHTGIHGIRRFGSAALDLCSVGVGQFGGFFEYKLSPWDFMAGQLFVTEAGGKVTDCLGKPLPLGKSSLLATNTILHPEILEIVAKHFEEYLEKTATS